MINYFDFRDKLYLVTGASSGLGRVVSEMIADCGGSVILTGRNKKRLEETRKQMSGEGHCIYDMDLLCPDYTELFEYARTKKGKLDGIVHCAGVAPVIPVGSLNNNRINECLTANFYSLMELMRLFSKRKYRAEKSSVVSVSSISSIYPDKCQSIYAASKAAMNTAVQGLALELAAKGVRINTVVPGAMDTEMTKKAFEEMGTENAERKLSKQVLGVIKPEDVSKVILFLLSDMSLAITGRMIFADGGYINF